MQEQERGRPQGRKPRGVMLGPAPPTQRRPGWTGYGAQSRAWPVDDDDRHKISDRAPMPPAMELHEIVSAHDPDETDALSAPQDPGERVVRVAGANSPFNVGYEDARACAQAPGGVHAGAQPRQIRPRLERIPRRHQPPHAIEGKPLQD